MCFTCDVCKALLVPFACCVVCIDFVSQPPNLVSSQGRREVAVAWRGVGVGETGWRKSRKWGGGGGACQCVQFLNSAAVSKVILPAFEENTNE